MKSNISHYYIRNMYFTLYMDAYEYCCNNNISINLIEKTKEYK